MQCVPCSWNVRLDRRRLREGPAVGHVRGRCCRPSRRQHAHGLEQILHTISEYV